MILMKILLLSPLIILAIAYWLFLATMAIDLLTLRKFRLFEKIWKLI